MQWNLKLGCKKTNSLKRKLLWVTEGKTVRYRDKEASGTFPSPVSSLLLLCLRSLSDPSLSTCSSAALSPSPCSAPPFIPPLLIVVGQASTNQSTTGTWGTAYAKRCLIFMSSYRGFKSLIRTAAQLSVPTASLAGCVSTYSPLSPALTYTSGTVTVTGRAHQCSQRTAW